MNTTALAISEPDGPVISEALLEALDLAAKLWHDANPRTFSDRPYVHDRGNVYMQLAEHAWFRNRQHRVQGLPQCPDVAAGAHVVYCARDTDGELLYIGVTSHFVNRMSAHRRKSPWWMYALTVQAYGYPTRDAANLAEERAIALHRPPWNRTY